MRMDTGMKWALVYFLGLFVLAQLVGCSTPTKALNFITPDRIGIGESQGSVTGSLNLSQSLFPDTHGDVDWGSASTMIWLEWDFPQWKEPTDYDRYLRKRVRTLNLEKDLLIAERELKKKNEVIDKTIEIIDTDLEGVIPEKGQEEMWPKKLTDLY